MPGTVTEQGGTLQVSMWRDPDTEICRSEGTPGVKTKGPMPVPREGSYDS